MVEMVRELSVASSLTWRYIIALMLVASLSTAAWFSLHMVISEQKSTAAVVNISGRQRMLSQQTALFANLLVHSPKPARPAIRNKLKDAIQLMEHSHHGLTHGDEKIGLPEIMSHTVRAMYFDGESALDTEVTNYIKIVNELLLLEDGSLTTTCDQLLFINRNAPTTLVSALDSMVKQYQTEGEESVGRLQKAETIFWLATLLLLGLEALLIFKPFVDYVKTIFGKLQNVTNELRLHQGNLEELIKQRTTELENNNVALQESEEKFRLISTAAKDAIAIIGTKGQVVYWNPAAEKIFGYEANEVVGNDLHTLLAPMRYRAEAQIGFERFGKYGVGNLIGKTIETLALRKNGDEFPVELSISAFWFQHSWHAMGILRDITERKALDEQIKRLAHYDALTNLPNRTMFNVLLQQAITVAKRDKIRMALLFIDLDEFKPVNDSHGHAVGDLLLVEMAKRISEVLRESDTVARLGGDEFIVLLPIVESDHDSTVVAEKIRHALNQPIELAGNFLKISSSIGIAVYPEHGIDEETLCKNADTAMYQAKASGRNAVKMFSTEK
jgi:diguanylate cyclase (GGDEF)-like protein/PAS domain S-box-containing protein